MQKNNDFFFDRQQAVERMREMSARSIDSDMPPVPHFAKLRNGEGSAKPRAREPAKAPPKPTENHGAAAGFPGLSDIPFLKNIGCDGDVSLLLGLFLILSAEKADKLLLYALLYILM